MWWEPKGRALLMLRLYTKAHWFRHKEEVVKLFLIIVADLIVTQKLEEVL